MPEYNYISYYRCRQDLSFAGGKLTRTSVDHTVCICRTGNLRYHRIRVSSRKIWIFRYHSRPNRAFEEIIRSVKQTGSERSADRSDSHNLHSKLAKTARLRAKYLWVEMGFAHRRRRFVMAKPVTITVQRAVNSNDFSLPFTAKRAVNSN